MGLADKIKELCIEKRITVAELERKTGISNGQIRKWNERSPKAENLSKVADYFNVTTDYLLGRDGKEENSADTKDLAEIMDSIMTYNGKELNQHDKDVVEGLISAYLNNKA
ncbi:helix-turn-helix domain-containing protein [Ligilactobacillus equi]